MPIPEICQFSAGQSGLLNMINVWSHDWAEHGYQVRTPGTGGYTGVFWLHSYNECGLTRIFKDSGTNGLSHSQLSKNLLYFLYSRSVKLIFTRGHITFPVTFKGRM